MLDQDTVAAISYSNRALSIFDLLTHETIEQVKCQGNLTMADAHLQKLYAFNTSKAGMMTEFDLRKKCAQT
jgi:hypothetical protein